MSKLMIAPSGYEAVTALRIERGQAQSRAESLAEETPIALVYNGISQAVMMATPLDLEDFVLGFSLSEGIIAHAGELLDIESVSSERGISMELRITEARFQQLKARRRSLTGRTGCGLCGQETLEQAIRPIPKVNSNYSLAPAEVSQAVAHLSTQQPLNAITGAVHAAGLWQHSAFLLREDVGRHNALDKLIGAYAWLTTRDGLVVISSRASYEMVHKVATAGFAIVAAISAPTALAVKLADEAGVCLIGFTRESRMTVYTHPQRLTGMQA
ncbi:formate dehydrogenase accessory sulfurtransferase FdhD [Chitinimonas sp. BJB300]|uniref:formate dehydrogenase accessory sulfurtransferase FdhD n=1 Tax=Chitinimonas sp. BJB300 TaxID=1559339 RepID=UPI000C10E4C1|nr:formate dehydrogenase accessory sulfurtransferase FdhD [Chitinimonas sp. BJB300]PHV12157.1 sulfurtransferase FdhD [Chitinimonas sp. BJB300]TSJ90111.1 formate dehydrogenase accessory sulfurtransferase FdhD [Chitinimonas sp. BJB300]